MIKKFKSAISVAIICLLITALATTTAYAEPEDYINDLWDNVNNALDNYINNGDTNTTPTEEATYDYSATEPEDPYYDYYEPTEDPYYDPYYEPETEPQYEEPTEEIATAIYAPTENEDYDYYYVPPTEPEEYVYEPEVLTETYTDAPFLERFALTDAGEGNLFIALGLWLAIIMGVIIVISVVIATHRRKKGN